MTKGKAALSSYQTQAVRLNRLEYHRLQNHIASLRNDLRKDLLQLERQEQDLKDHFTNVVRVVKSNAEYQLWKQETVHETVQDEAKDFIESLKGNQKLARNNRRGSTTSSNGISIEPPRPLLVFFDNKSLDSNINKTNKFLRPKTSPNRLNPLLSMLNECLLNPKTSIQKQQLYPSESSSSTTAASRKLLDKCTNDHKASNIDVFYRMALQNQTAYKSVDKKIIEERKLHDKQFALQYRALHSSIRLARLAH